MARQRGLSMVPVGVVRVTRDVVESPDGEYGRILRTGSSKGSARTVGDVDEDQVR